MGTKRTPGPWSVSETNPLEVVAGSFDVAFCGPKKGLDISQYETRKANAMLVAAAPDLLDALAEAVMAIDDEFLAMGDEWKEQPIMHRKNKTLAKARAALAQVK